jgi:hypothetical protein
VTDVPGAPESWGPAVVLGPEDAEDLALVEGEPTSPPLHLAFVASDPEAVDAFHAAALGSGGRDNGPPGLRERYNPPLLCRLRHRPRRAQHRSGLPRPLAVGDAEAGRAVDRSLHLAAWRSNAPADIESLLGEVQLRRIALPRTPVNNDLLAIRLAILRLASLWLALFQVGPALSSARRR